jgi:Protein of unknown function (DUF1573)
MRALAVLFGLIVFSASAQLSESIVFDEKAHDFGSIKESGGNVSTEFGFLNNSGRPIRILDVKPSCGCTTPDWTRDLIEPGKRGVIKASFDPRGKIGYFNKSITVPTDYNGVPILLAIKGNVETKSAEPDAKFDVSNGSLQTKVSTFNLGKIHINKENGFKSFDVKNSGKDILTIKDYKAPAHIKVQFPEKLAAGEAGVVKIFYDAKMRKAYGFTSDNVELITDDKEGAIKAYSIFATVEEYFPPVTPESVATAPILKMEGQEIKFGEMFETGTLQREVVIRNTGKSNLNIRALQPNCACMTAQADQSDIKPGEASKIKITLSPKGRPGIQNKSIAVYSNDPRNPVQRITLSGYVR